jgi:hypothetical protein
MVSPGKEDKGVPKLKQSKEIDKRGKQEREKE